MTYCEIQILARRLKFKAIRSMATYVPTEKIMLASFNRELIANEKKRSRDIEINTMNNGKMLMKARGFEIQDAANCMDVLMIKDTDETTGTSVTIDFDCWSHCVKDKSPEAYDIIVRKRDNDNILVITCVNHPEFLPVGMRIVPNTKDIRDMSVYGGPKFTRLPENVLKGILGYLKDIGVDEEVGSFIHDYIKFKVKNETHRVLKLSIDKVLTP